MPNPYTPFAPAIQNFFGRESIIAAFRERLDPGSDAFRLARHLLLVGDGGIGKTSLIERMKEEASTAAHSRVHLVSIDVGEYSFGDLEGLINDLNSQLPQPIRLSSRAKAGLGLNLEASTKEVLKQLARSLRNGIALGIPPSIEFSPGALYHSAGSGQSLSRRLADWWRNMLLLSAESSDLILMLVDQMGKLVELPGGLLVAQSLVELMMNSSRYGLGNLLLVMAIRPERKGILEHRFHQEIFHSSWVIRKPLYPLADEAARQLISEPARRQGVYLETGSVDEFRKRCGHHPYYLQIACYRLWEYLASKNRLRQPPVKFNETEIEEVRREAQGAIFSGFSPEEKRILRLLALSPSPLSRMQIRSRAEDIGIGQALVVDHVLDGLMEHRHRPVRYHETAQAYSISHDLFADYIAQYECDREQRDLAGLQAVLDHAKVNFEITGELLTESQLDHLWRFRQQLNWGNDGVEITILSEFRRTGFAAQWAEWFLRSKDPETRLAALRKMEGKVSPRVWDLLSELQNDSSKSICQASREALDRSHRPWAWADDWDYDSSTV